VDYDGHPRAYRGRFAPTPSGPLHLGSLLTALASYLDARAAQGEWLLRIDDLDIQRSRPGARDVILKTLEVLSLHWDGEVTHQHARRWRYEESLERLRATGLLYACDCTRRDTHDAWPHVSGACPGQCRDRNLVFTAGKTALRIRASHSPICFEDRIKGPQTKTLIPEPGDFIVFRRDAIHAYHLATVMDDHDAGITDIVRGEDLLASTPEQIHLQKSLGLRTPNYAHTPLMIRPDGKKLSKSAGAPPVDPNHAGRILSVLLGHLGILLPEVIAQASPREMLEWAIPQWRISSLQSMGPITVEDNRIPV
jgi:glutamyl-Q tRNA(Asp) synthetase